MLTHFCSLARYFLLILLIEVRLRILQRYTVFGIIWSQFWTIHSSKIGKTKKNVLQKKKKILKNQDSIDCSICIQSYAFSSESNGFILSCSWLEVLRQHSRTTKWVDMFQRFDHILSSDRLIYCMLDGRYATNHRKTSQK